MWLAITWAAGLLDFAGALIWAFRQGKQHGIAQEANETYEAENNARAYKRRISKRLQQMRDKR